MLENNYKENLEHIKHLFPSIYEGIIKENTDELELIIDKNNINIAINNYPIYPNNSLNFINNMVDNYLMYPKSFSASPFSGKGEEQFSQIHKKYIAKIEDLFEEYQTAQKSYNNDCLNVLLFFGIGTGMQITNLLSKKDVNHLIFIDINFKFLKASLYFINWGTIIKEFTTSTKSLTFIIDDNVDNIVNGLINVIYKDKVMFFSYIHFFVSYKESFFDEILKKFRTNYHKLTLGWGFYDDELTSTKHTLQNLNNNIKFYNSNVSKKDLQCSVLIVANGPSLDRDIQYIQSHKSSVIVFSCGTALSALEKYGIVPDYHFEMERNNSTYEVLMQGNSLEFLKKINFIGLNLVFPEVFLLFKTAKMVFRGNDAGASLSNSITNSLNHTNPTVANFALSFASEIGFKNIYLFGMDMGYFEGTKHHSKKSGYYHLKNETSSSKHYKATIYLKSNLNKSKIVASTYILNWCKQRAENCIVQYNVEQDENINYFNCSDGAYIKGTISLESSKIKLTSYEKENALTILESYFEYPSNNKKKLKQNLKFEKKAINHIVLDILKEIKKLKYENRGEMYDLFYKIYSTYLLKNFYKKGSQSSLIFSLLRGTLLTLFTNTYICSILIPGSKDAYTFNKNATAVIQEFLEQLVEDTKKLKLNI